MPDERLGNYSLSAVATVLHGTATVAAFVVWIVPYLSGRPITPLTVGVFAMLIGYLIYLAGSWIPKTLAQRAEVLAELDGADADADDRPPLSIVSLMAEPETFALDDVAAAVAAAYGVSFPNDEPGEDATGDGPDAVRLSPDGVLVLQTIPDDGTGSAAFLVNDMRSADSHGVGLICQTTPYVGDSESAAEGVRELRRRRALTRHRGWWAADVVGDEPVDAASLRSAYGRLGRVLAALLRRSDAECLGLFFPREGELEPWTDESMSALASGNVRSALSANRQVPVIEAGGEGYEAAMDAAVKTARGRWPEFLAASESRTPENEGLFGVKFELSNDGENTEFPWLTVESIEGGRIDGRLGNEPLHAGTYALDDPVTVPASEIWDWVFPGDDGEMVGLFTNEVIERFSGR